MKNMYKKRGTLKIRGFFKLIVKSDLHTYTTNQFLILSERNRGGVLQHEGGGEGLYCVKYHRTVYVLRASSRCVYCR